jgi:proline racemase
MGHRLRVGDKELRVDTVFVGGFLAIVSAQQLGLSIGPEQERQLAAAGMAIVEAANEQIEVSHPQRPEVRTIDGVIVAADESLSRSAVIYGEAHVDRSPCGTGTVAKMALLHRLGRLEVGADFLSEGLLGTRFEGRIVEGCVEAGLEAIRGQIRARAHLTGVHQFVVDPTDALGEGFILRSS